MKSTRLPWLSRFKLVLVAAASYGVGDVYVAARLSSRGVPRFLEQAREAGIDGLIVVDLPPEEDFPPEEDLPEGHILVDEVDLKDALRGALPARRDHSCSSAAS